MYIIIKTTVTISMYDTKNTAYNMFLYTTDWIKKQKHTHIHTHTHTTIRAHNFSCRLTRPHYSNSSVN